ncbi:MAG: hypothetical protein CM1200mP5_4020 [Candidatus Pelagibacterales bacterium]|nr:MAG: hypothetical protein CM1200mP5_4020 [Pelagibacterales bacterium]
MKTFNFHSAKEVKEASKLASSNSAFFCRRKDNKFPFNEIRIGNL